MFDRKLKVKLPLFFGIVITCLSIAAPSLDMPTVMAVMFESMVTCNLQIHHHHTI
eukprot:m.131575 g.131575  ORF g.131575 m.131575 type:complete len:55 (-) comp29556_c0_seq1:1753-1917(-)